MPWLAPLVRAAPGKRIPGCPNAHEALIRAITGQQISVAAGREQLARVAAVSGAPLETPLGQVDRLFPAASDIGASVDAWFAGPSQRRRTVVAAMALAAAGGLHPGRDADETAAALAEVPGVGGWTIAYTLLRGLQVPDPDLSGDAALLRNARTLGVAESRARLSEALDAARPWRGYAALHLWASSTTPGAS